MQNTFFLKCREVFNRGAPGKGDEPETYPPPLEDRRRAHPRVLAWLGEAAPGRQRTAGLLSRVLPEASIPQHWGIRSIPCSQQAYEAPSQLGGHSNWEN